jgi:hypothetical protein
MREAGFIDALSKVVAALQALKKAQLLAALALSSCGAGGAAHAAWWAS